jgi:predicted LPLAT superfamily acyltransferase
MEKQTPTGKRNFWRDIFNWLKLFAKTIQHKIALKRKSFQRFPNEAPH